MPQQRMDFQLELRMPYLFAQPAAAALVPHQRGQAHLSGDSQASSCPSPTRRHVASAGLASAPPLTGAAPGSAATPAAARFGVATPAATTTAGYTFLGWGSATQTLAESASARAFSAAAPSAATSSATPAAATSPLYRAAATAAALVAALLLVPRSIGTPVHILPLRLCCHENRGSRLVPLGFIVRLRASLGD